MFALSYCIFEIPSGALGDRIGARRVLTRIVVWWSAFTALTGAAGGYYPLLAIRFAFGAGEAGAFPNASIVISRWYSIAQRATMGGTVLMAGQLGGAIAPLLVTPLQTRYGWRASFYVFGAAGVIWAAIWYAWFRDTPEEKRGLPAAVEHGAAAAPRFPWRSAFRSQTVWAILVSAFCYIYVYNFFQTWFHTFLVKGRGYTESSLFLSALPYLLAMCTNMAGGFLSDTLVRKVGRTLGRRIVGMAGLTVAAIFTVAATSTHRPVLTLLFLTLVYGGITFQQSAVVGACLDIGHAFAGSLIGLMNTASQLGGLVGSVAFGYLVDHFHSYDAPFLPMAAVLAVGALCWLKVDAAKELKAD
jgi:MFS family permease